MARSLQNKPQVEAPSARYPEGRIKDDDGSGTTGTPVNEDVYGDIHQFFARLMAENGITPNEIPDNAYDGFQLIKALCNEWIEIPLLSGFTSTLYYRRVFKNGFQFKGAIQKASATGSTFAVCSIPSEIKSILGALSIISFSVEIKAYDGLGVTIPGRLDFNNLIPGSEEMIFESDSSLSSVTLNLSFYGIAIYL